MILGRLVRRKPRSGSGLLALGQEQTPGSKGSWRQWIILACAWVVLVTAMTKRAPVNAAISLQDIDAQTIAQETVRADFYLETETIQASEEKRDAAVAAVPETYRVDRARVVALLDELGRRIQTLDGQREELESAIRRALTESSSAEDADDVVTKAVADFALRLSGKPAFERFPDPAFLAVWLTPAPVSLPERQFAAEAPSRGDVLPGAPRKVIGLSEPTVLPLQFAHKDQLTELAKDGLEYVLTLGIVKPGLPKSAAERPIVILREQPFADQTVTQETPLGEVPEPSDAEELLRARIVEKAKQLAAKLPEGSVDWAKLQGAAFEMAKLNIADTLSYDRVDTEGARSRARAAVAPVLKEIQPGEIIQRAGERWTKQSRADAKAYMQAMQTGPKPAARTLTSLIAHGIFAAMTLYFLHKSTALLFSRRQSRMAVPGPETSRNLTLAVLLICSALVVGRVAYYFEPSGFVVPVASIGILLAILVNARLAAMTGFLTVALLSALYGYDWRVLVVGCAMSLAGVSAIYIVRRRSDMTRAAVQATVFGLLTMLAITLATDSLLSEAAVRRLALVGMNGALCLLIVPGLLAPLERLFGITTDIQLLEYSDLNNEVLRRMAVEVPATYAHSLMLGQLAEAAAEAIGANGLLARVCAYYHDVGKLRRPEYFSENQTGINIHDELSPRLSARAIAAHVTQGVEMARECHLPKPIVDGIREHHGTSLISFFYQQALEHQKHGDIREEDFRYPGPRPQRRETAILMICDAVESGVRSIKNPNEERIREFVDKVITGRSADRQFDDCDLTLKELDTIGSVVARRILSMLHTRIAYPETSRAKRDASNVIRMSGSGGVE